MSFHILHFVAKNVDGKLFAILTTLIAFCTRIIYIFSCMFLGLFKSFADRFLLTSSFIARNLYIFLNFMRSTHQCLSNGRQVSASLNSIFDMRIFLDGISALFVYIIEWYSESLPLMLLWFGCRSLLAFLHFSFYATELLLFLRFIFHLHQQLHRND